MSTLPHFFSIYKKEEGLTIATKEDFQWVYDKHFRSYKEKTKDDTERIFNNLEKKKVDKFIKTVEGLQQNGHR